MIGGVVKMPIDPDFHEKPIVGTHKGHNVRGEVAPPTKLGIHGTQVAVDHDICNGDAICVSVCPVSVFQMIDTPKHPVSEQKSDPVNEAECIFCRACETNCPTQAIKITEP
jgi:NAD-dependent dihydropyrimidine dehydrogenase PreA subunit